MSAREPGRRAARSVWTGQGRSTSIALLVAGSCAVALVVAAFWAPMYRTATETPTGAVTYGTATLVEANGPGAVLVLTVPLAVTVLVACALLIRPRRETLALAWTLTGLFAAFSLLAMLSVGIFVIPVTVGLVVACATARPQTRQHELSSPGP